MGVNNLNILGNIGRDPKKFEKIGSMFVKFSVGVNEVIKGEKKTTWFECIAFNNKADYILKSCQKGTQVFVEGAFRSDEYEGKTRWTLFVNNIVLISGRKEKDGG